MSLFKKIFKSKKEKQSKSNNDLIGGLSIKLSTDENGVSVTSSPIGTVTGSKHSDFYVYEWFIKDTGEVFYVGKGRGNRYKEYHARAYIAEEIKKLFDTGSRFVATDLTEIEAIELENETMLRILNETNHRLTNRIIPLLAKRGNGYDRSPNTPAFEFEKAPVLYATEIDEHYFEKSYKEFDKVTEENLKAVMFIERNIRNEIETIYGGEVGRYIDETKQLLNKHGSRVLKTQFAKSVTAWIYIGDDDVYNYEIDQEKVIERIGREVPTYHLIDVWKFLKSKYGDLVNPEVKKIEIKPYHNRVPLNEIKNFNNWEKGFDEGMPYWEDGDAERKNGNVEKAISLFDKARYHGYEAPALYNSYAMAYRKLKDYDNEIAILDEAIKRFSVGNNEIVIQKWKDRRDRSIELKMKNKL